MSRCFLCQQKGARLQPGCGLVPQFTEVPKPAIPLVRTSPPMGGQVGQGWAGHCAKSWRTYRIRSRRGVVTNNYNEGRDDERDCDPDPWGSESHRSIPVFFTVPKRCPLTFVVFKYTHNQGHNQTRLDTAGENSRAYALPPTSCQLASRNRGGMEAAGPLPAKGDKPPRQPALR